MAQTKERTQAATKAPPKATQRTSSPAPTSAAAPAPAPWSAWLTRLRPPLTNALTRLRPPLTNAPRADGKPRQRAGGSIFKSFFGILIWFIASQFIMYVLILVDGLLKKPGELPPLEGTHLLPPNTPLLGWITPFLLLYGGAVIGLWFLLIRMNLIPRDFFNARAQAQERARRQASAATASGIKASGASTGPKKTRTQRRYAETQAQLQAASKNNGKNAAKGAAKPLAKATSKPAAKPAAKPTVKPTAKPAVQLSAKASDSRKVVAAATGTNDQVYDQVRAADRLRRRRVAKR